MSTASRYSATLHILDSDSDDAGMTSPISAAERASGQTAAVDALEGFVREHYAGLLQFLRHRSAVIEDAEDAAQESLTRFVQFAVDTRPIEAWKPTLYRIAINVLHDRARRARARAAGGHVSCDEVEIESDAPSALEQAEREQQRAALREAVLALPPRCRQIFLLKRLHGMTNAAIARRCGISVKVVERHSARALVLLRRKLGFIPPDAY